MVPAQPGEARAVGREARAREEVVAGGEDGLRRRSPRSIATSVLTASPAPPWSSRTAIRRPRAPSTTSVGDSDVAARAVTGSRHAAAACPVDALVGVVAEEQLAVGRDREGAAAVFVDARARRRTARGLRSVRAAVAIGTRRRRCARLRPARLSLQKTVLADDRDLAEADRSPPRAARRRAATASCRTAPPACLGRLPLQSRALSTRRPSGSTRRASSARSRR